MIESNEAILLATDAGTPPNVHVSIRRFFAFLIDGIFLAILQAIVSIGFGVNRFISTLPPIFGSPTFNNSSKLPHAVTTTVNWPWLVLIALLYFFLQEAAFSTTLGKAIMGLRVIDMNGRSITFSAALIRNVLLLVDTFVSLLVGGISMAISPYRQRIGDRFARTFVVDARTAPRAVYPRETFQRRMSIAIASFALLVVICFVVAYYTGPMRIIEGWKNTNAGIFERKTVTWYNPGNPVWKDDTVTYHIHYTVQSGTKQCIANITFQRTYNIVWPWTPSGYEDSCPPQRSYSNEQS